jgi:HSP20 family molecular chaperone IbpA
VEKDSISARMENGVLTVQLPKMQQTVTKAGRQIEVI